MPDLRLAGLCRSACGALGCTAAANVIAIGLLTTAEAATAAEPRPRRQVSAVCDRGVPTSLDEQPDERRALGPRLPAGVLVRSRSAPADRTDGPPHDRSGRLEPRLEPRHEAATGEHRSPERPSGRAARSDGGPTSMETVLLLLLLLPVIAATCYPLRRRAAAHRPPAPSPRAVIRCMPPLDPYAIDAVGLAGPGALATARVMALAALGTSSPSLVVIPRPDVTRMFGVDEDEFLDDDITELFIPGNLDAALAYLETELAIRRNTGKGPLPRLLLIADCAGEIDRIHALMTRHRGAVSAILMGPWTGDRATVTAGGVVTVPPADAPGLPDRLPTMSRTRARSLLDAAAEPPPSHKRPPRRSTARRT